MLDNSDFYDNSQDYYTCEICEEQVKDVEDTDFLPFEYICEECSSKLAKCIICNNYYNADIFQASDEQDICEECSNQKQKENKEDKDRLNITKRVLNKLVEEQCNTLTNELKYFVKDIELNRSLLENLFKIIKKSLEYEKLIDKLKNSSIKNKDSIIYKGNETGSLLHSILKEVLRTTTLSQTINLQQDKYTVEVINRVDADLLQIKLEDKTLNFDYNKYSFDVLKIELESLLKLNNIDCTDNIIYELVSASNIFELKKVAEKVPAIGFDNITLLKIIYVPVEVAINKDVLKGEEIREIQLKL